MVSPHLPSPPGTPSYNVFRPATAPSTGRLANARPEEFGRGLPVPEDDPRHLDDSVPIPWLRYFFPKDFDLREGNPTNPFYQYFDVAPTNLQEDLSIPPPDWSPNQYFQLSFTQLHTPSHLVLGERRPVKAHADHTHGALDVTQAGLLLLDPANEEHLQQILAFAGSVSSFRCRTWKDAFPLVDLLRGVLQYLLQHYRWGADLIKARAESQMRAELEAAKARMQAEYNRQLAEVAARARAEYDAKLESLKDSLRDEVASDLQAALLRERDEKDRLLAQIKQLETQVKRMGEQMVTLDRQVAHLNQQMDDQAAKAKADMAAKDAEMALMAGRMAELEGCLTTARRAIVDALNAETKADAMQVAMTALTGTIPGAASYLAELRTASDVDHADPLPGLLTQASAAAVKLARAAQGDDVEDEDIADGAPLSSLVDVVDLPRPLERLVHVTPGLLRSPLAGVGSDPTSVAHDASVSEAREQLVYRYILASPGHEFMVGQRMPWGTGVSWVPILDPPQRVHIPNVAADAAVHLFRPHPPDATPQGAYFSAAITGAHGEAIGMLCVDTMGAAAGRKKGAKDLGKLNAATQDFVAALAGALSKRAQKDQEAFHEGVLAVEMAMQEPQEEEAPPADPEPFADLSGGLKMFRQALDMLKGLSDEDLAAFASGSAPDDATLAVLRGILAAAGQVADGDWDHIRGHLNRSLIGKLTDMDPSEAWAEWTTLCKTMRPVLSLPSDPLPGLAKAGLDADPVRTSLSMWLMGARAISAANALRALLEQKLKKVNAALMQAFSGGEGSNSLVEIKSYRQAPPITFATIQGVLMLAGHSEEEVQVWGKMRSLINFKLIKSLTTLKPAQVRKPVMKAVKKLVRDTVTEEEVRKESKATLALHLWLKNFSRMAYDV